MVSYIKHYILGLFKVGKVAMRKSWSESNFKLTTSSSESEESDMLPDWRREALGRLAKVAQL